MIDHLSITVSDIETSKEFYLKTLAPLGLVLLTNKPKSAGFGLTAGHGQNIDPGGSFWIEQGAPMTPRVHFAFSAASHAQVESFFTEGCAAGGSDNGAPGLRPTYHSNYYAAFLIDPDGYNIEAVCHVTQG